MASSQGPIEYYLTPVNEVMYRKFQAEDAERMENAYRLHMGYNPEGEEEQERFIETEELEPEDIRGPDCHMQGIVTAVEGVLDRPGRGEGLETSQGFRGACVMLKSLPVDFAPVELELPRFQLLNDLEEEDSAARRGEKKTSQISARAP